MFVLLLLHITATFALHRDCGVVFARVTQQEVQIVADIFLQTLTTSATVQDLARSNLLEHVQYDISIAKVCGSCKDFLNLNTNNSASSCSGGYYGSDATHSALVFAPIDPATNQLVTGRIRGMLTFAEMALEAPTAAFPCNLTNYLDVTPSSDATELLVDYLVPLLLTSGGVISVLPDGIGLGESSEYHQAVLSKPLHGQAAIVSYLSAQDYIQNKSAGCTELASTLSLHGYGAGGYAAVAAAESLQDTMSDMELQQLYVGSAPLDLISQLSHSMSQLQQQTSPTASSSSAAADTLVRFRKFLALWGYGYSSTDFSSFLANAADSDQTLLDKKWLLSIQHALSGDSLMDLDAYFRQSYDPLGLINADLISMFMTAQVRNLEPCREYSDDSTNLLCQALVDQSMDYDDLENLDTIINLCQSPDDGLIVPYLPINNMMNENFELNKSPYSMLQPQGNHLEGAVSCAIQPVMYYRRTGLRTELPNPPASCPSSSKSDLLVCPLLTRPPAPAPTSPPVYLHDFSEAPSNTHCSTSGVTVLSLLATLLWW
jgi:hypothetical protein